MGRKSKLTDAQWGRLSGLDWHSIANGLLSISNNENAVIQVLRLMLIFGHLHRLLKVRPISRYRFEVTVSTGRIDLLLFHDDGGVSIVEAKADRAPRDIAPGIGQLFMYEAAVHKSMRPAYVNKILIAPIRPEQSVDLTRACELADVQFTILPVFEDMKREIDSIRTLSEDHG